MAKMYERPLEELLGVDVSVRNEKILESGRSDETQNSSSFLNGLTSNNPIKEGQGHWQLKLLKSAFNGKTVVDLGAGKTSAGYFFATLGSAEAYVGVEPYHAETLREELINKSYRRNALFKGLKPIPFAVSNLDMLSFLQNLKSNSVSMIVAGIDNNIVNRSYRREVEKEIQRTLSKNGGILEYHSYFEYPLSWKLESLNKRGGKVKHSDKWRLSAPPYIAHK